MHVFHHFEDDDTWTALYSLMGAVKGSKDQFEQQPDQPDTAEDEEASSGIGSLGSAVKEADVEDWLVGFART